MTDASELAPGVYVGPVFMLLGVAIVLLRSRISLRLRRRITWDEDLTGPAFVGFTGLLALAGGVLGLAVGLLSDGPSDSTGRSSWDNLQTALGVIVVLGSAGILALTAARAAAGERGRALRRRQLEWFLLIMGALFLVTSL